jgi:hypothetical protein
VLSRRLAGPVASPATPGSSLLGPRLMALDGTTLDLSDTAENEGGVWRDARVG